MWSDGPAPPRRLSPPVRGSTRRTPKDCNSLISRSVGIVVGETLGSCWASIGFIGLCSRAGEGCRIGRVQRRGGAVVPQQRQQFGARVVADRIHHPLAL